MQKMDDVNTESDHLVVFTANGVFYAKTAPRTGSEPINGQDVEALVEKYTKLFKAGTYEWLK